jgi:hypothetical protein
LTMGKHGVELPRHLGEHFVHHCLDGADDRSLPRFSGDK